MKILLLTSALDLGGAQRVVTSLSNAWSARGEEVTLILTFSGGRGETFYEVSGAVELIYLSDVVGIRRRNILSYVQRIHALRRLIAERSPDVIVSFLSNVNITAILSSAFLPIPVIICERTDPSFYPPRDLLHGLCKLTYRFADMLTVQTDSIASKAQRLYPGLRSIRSIPNPLPEAIAGYRKIAGKDRKILLSLGRLSPLKQFDTLVDAFVEVAPSFDAWDLHIYGDGPLKESLQRKIDEAGLQLRGFLKGTTNRPWEVMADAEVFAMTSRQEGFPNALLEAMGVGLPCVVFDCPSGPWEITRGGKDAILVPLNDRAALTAALARLMRDEELRISLGAHGRESVHSRFSLPEVINRWDELFREVGAVH